MTSVVPMSRKYSLLTPQHTTKLFRPFPDGVGCKPPGTFTSGKSGQAWGVRLKHSSQDRAQTKAGSGLEPMGWPQFRALPSSAKPRAEMREPCTGRAMVLEWKASLVWVIGSFLSLLNLGKRPDSDPAEGRTLASRCLQSRVMLREPRRGWSTG